VQQPGYVVLAVVDLIEGTLRWRLWGLLGWQDIRQRYRRSTIGPFWLTLSMAINIAAIGFVWGSLFGFASADFFPYLTLGLVFWSLISGLISEGCTAFTQASGFIKQVRRPLFTYVVWAVWRNTLVFLHNFLIFPLIAIIFDVPINGNIFYLLIGFPLVWSNLCWIALLCGLISTRFRDVPAMVQNALNVLFFVTPVFWKPAQLGSKQFIADLNPLTHLIAVLRLPLIGEAPSALAWVYCASFAVIGWVVTFAMFARFRARVVYWL
jgi:homopolymeric O-antigen transport system permease protein